MADDTTTNMVLRTVYLPLELDRTLKKFAFDRDISKSELIRDLINRGMQAIEASGEPGLEERLIRHRDGQSREAKAEAA